MVAGRMVGGFNKTRLRHITILAAHPPSDITFLSTPSYYLSDLANSPYEDA